MDDTRVFPGQTSKAAFIELSNIINSKSELSWPSVRKLTVKIIRNPEFYTQVFFHALNNFQVSYFAIIYDEGNKRGFFSDKNKEEIIDYVRNLDRKTSFSESDPRYRKWRQLESFVYNNIQKRLYICQETKSGLSIDPERIVLRGVPGVSKRKRKSFDRRKSFDGRKNRVYAITLLEKDPVKFIRDLLFYVKSLNFYLFKTLYIIGNKRGIINDSVKKEIIFIFDSVNQNNPDYQNFIKFINSNIKI